jgi:hypothetical protein
MAHCGAKGKTQKLLAKSLFLPDNLLKAQNAIKQMLEKFTPADVSG